MELSNKIKIVAECGVNHGGDLSLAHKYIKEAYKAGADAIKFQTWLPGEITGIFTAKCNYMQTGNGKDLSRYEISELLRLNHNQFFELKKHADELGIEFMSTPDGLDSLRFLTENKLLKTLKIGSTEITNIPFLNEVAKIDLPIYLSTGTASFDEVSAAMSLFRGRFHELTLMQCTSAYPCQDEYLNLNVLKQYKNAFDIKVGFSDHSIGKTASYVAIGLGAKVIEKHIYIESDIWTPDKDTSMPIDQFKEFISEIRRIEKMLGSKYKHLTNVEKNNLSSIRRGICASKILKAGTIIKEDDICLKRPFNGLDYSYTKFFVGKTLKYDKELDQPFEISDI